MLINPIANSVIYTNGQGLDLHTDPPNEFAIADAELARIYNSIQEAQRNAPGGFAGLDNLSTVNAAVRVQYLDAVTLDGLVPRSGELWVTNDSKELRYGDGLKPGGFRAGLSSKSMIYVSADGTPTENGTNLINAYARAKTANPNGAAKSNINRMAVILGAGVYDLVAAGVASFVHDTPFIDIIGLGGNADATRLQIVGLSINETCYDWGWRNLTFYKSVTSHGITWRLNDVNPITINWENLKIEGTFSTDNFIQAFSRTAGVTSSISGTVKNVKTACNQILHGASQFASHTNNCMIDDCTGGNRFFSPQGTTNPVIFTGTVRNCVFSNTQLTSFQMTSTTQLHNTKFGMPLNFCVTGARITYCRFVPVAGVASLKALTAGQTPYIAHCELSATGIDATNITNAAGANPFNVLSDG